MSATIRGRVWKLGDNVSTDLLLPGKITYPVMTGRMTPEEAAMHCMEATRPGWHRQVAPGDIVVGGANFGAGSGRPAYLPLRALGVQAVVAESVARLFYRNCINGGFLVIACPGIGALVEEGQHVEIDLAAGRVRAVERGTELGFAALPPDSPPMEILRADGLIPYLKAHLGLG